MCLKTLKKPMDIVYNKVKNLQDVDEVSVAVLRDNWLIYALEETSRDCLQVKI